MNDLQREVSFEAFLFCGNSVDCEATDGTCLSPEEFKEISEDVPSAVLISTFVSFGIPMEIAALKIKQERLNAKENL